MPWPYNLIFYNFYKPRPRPVFFSSSKVLPNNKFMSKEKRPKAKPKE